MGRDGKTSAPQQQQGRTDPTMTIKTASIAALSLLAFALPASGALALDRHVRVTNDTSYTIREFYASNVGSNNWEEDILGREMLEPGQTININIDDASGYCKYDFRAVFEDGGEAIKQRVNVCEISRFTFTE
jgi:hypothetical protein